MGPRRGQAAPAGHAAGRRASCSCWRSRCSNLQLGQQNNAQMPKSTTVRQAYDLIDKGFGPGINGPLLIAVDFGKAPGPQRPEEAQPAAVSSNSSRSSRPSQQTTAAARGAGRAARRGAVRGRAAGLLAAADQEGEAGGPAGAVPEDARRATRVSSTSRTRSARRRASRTSRRRSSTTPATPPSFTVIPTTAAVRGRHDDLVHHLRDRVIPEADQGDHADRLRRRPDGLLHRPRLTGSATSCRS